MIVCFYPGCEQPSVTEAIGYCEKHRPRWFVCVECKHFFQSDRFDTQRVKVCRSCRPKRKAAWREIAADNYLARWNLARAREQREGTC